MDLTGTKAGLFAEAIDALREYKEDESGPLFSILIRTQGNRRKLLEEALCSVIAQTEQRFEVLVLLHLSDSSGSALQTVSDVIKKFPQGFQSKVRTVVVTRKGRSAPLNDGIKQATGKMICLLDDDDVLYDHHFSCVADALYVNPNALVLQTFASRRTLTVLENADCDTYPYSVSKIEPAYTEAFDAGKQLRENFVPSCNFFFSRALVTALDIRFDESLEVLEDWKFLMDLNKFADVTTVPTITTAIGTRTNKTNTVGNPAFQELWRTTRLDIQKKIAGEARLLSTKESQDLSMVFAWNEEAFIKLTTLSQKKSILKRILRKGNSVARRVSYGLLIKLPRPIRVKVDNLLRRS